MKYLVYILITAVIVSLFSATVCAESIDRDILASYMSGVNDHDLAVMLAVGSVILNRCYDDRFPDSVIENGSLLGIMPASAPSEMAKYAANVVLSGKDLTGGALFMFRTDDEGSAKLHGDHVTFSTGGLCFSLR